MTLREINERIAAIRAEALEIRNAHPNGIPAETDARVDALMTELDTLTAQQTRQQRLDDIDRRSTAGRPLSTGRDRFEDQAQLVRASHVIQAGMGIVNDDTARVREVSQEIATRSGRAPQGLYFPTDARPTREQRATFSLSTGNGAGLVQTDIAPSMIDALRAKSAVIGLGATVIGDLVGNLALPRLSASATTYWVPDGTALTVSNPTIDQVTFSPHHVGGLVSLSRSLILQSSPAAQTVVENDLAAIISTAIDNAAISGSGSGGQPAGLLTAGPTVVAGGTNGLAISWANIQALVGAIDTSNALAGRLGFVTNAKVTKSMRSTLRTAADTASNFIISQDGTLAGYPLVSTQNVTSAGTKGTGIGLSTLIFGDWSSLVIAEWSALDILVNPYGSSYAVGGIDVRAMASVDIGFRHLASFAAITDIIAA
jgi:HK97 family phage major capsid protein